MQILKVPESKKQKPAKRVTLSILCILFAITTACSAENSDPAIQSSVEDAQLHTHEFSGTYRQIRSGLRTLPLSSVADHNHEITITEEQSALLELGYVIAITSSESQMHSHRVTLQIYRY